MHPLQQSLPDYQSLPLLFVDLQLDELDQTTQQLIAKIDALLPQTQCGLCGYRDGCLPYAHAIATKGESSNLCVPGGDETAAAIAQLCRLPALPAKASKWSLDPRTNRPQEMRAVIDENACIGCTKCIPACPVDAIIGTGKHMHSVITNLCTGCELCIAPCPVDCIRLEVNPTPSAKPRAVVQQHLKQRYHAHLKRLTAKLQNNTLTVASHTEAKLTNALQAASSTKIDKNSAKNAIELAKLRTQIKKLNKQLAMRFDAGKQVQLHALQAQLQQLA